jgi:hypothetical protein
MQTLLGRELTGDEQALSQAVRKHLTNPRQLPKQLWQGLGLARPDPLFATVMSMVTIPPQTVAERALCAYLLANPEFFVFLSQPEAFDHSSLILICRTLLSVDPRFDAKLASSLMEDVHSDTLAVLRILGVLDEVSAGGRLNFVLTHLMRDSAPAVAAKTALVLGRRVSNPKWVERQLSSDDPRLRANVVESLWSVDAHHTRTLLAAALNDSNNRVVGNALFGLHLLKDDSVPEQLGSMLGHLRPEFRATAAWVIGKTGEKRYLDLLARAADDPDEHVRTAAQRAIETLSAEEPPAAAPAEENKPVPAPVRRPLMISRRSSYPTTRRARVVG